jgi:MFS family permease
VASSVRTGSEKDPFRLVRALRQRNFRLFWFGQLVSVMGTWMQSIGQAWLVLDLTHSPVQLGVVGALQLLPVLLFSLFTGVFVDRLPKRRLLLLTQSAALLQALALWYLVASHSIMLWQIYVLALLLGVTFSLDKPARQAFVVEVVGREDLPNAVALKSALDNLARIVGPSLGGVVIAVSGVATLFLLNAVSYLAVILALALIRISEVHTQPSVHLTPAYGQPMTVWQGLREGLAYLWCTPALLLPMTVVGLGLLFGSNFNVILPLYATEVLAVGAPGFGALSGALGVGALLGALWLAWTSRRPTIGRILLDGAIFGALLAVFSLTRSFLLALVVIASVGCAETLFVERYAMLSQALPPDHMRGRVMSVSVLFIDGTVPLGYMLMGWLSSRFSVPAAVLVGAALTLVVVGVGWLARVPTERNLEDLSGRAEGSARTS